MVFNLAFFVYFLLAKLKSLTDDFQKMVEAMRRNFYKEEYLL